MLHIHVHMCYSYLPWQHIPPATTCSKQKTERVLASALEFAPFQTKGMWSLTSNFLLPLPQEWVIFSRDHLIPPGKKCTYLKHSAQSQQGFGRGKDVCLYIFLLCLFFILNCTYLHKRRNLVSSSPRAYSSSESCSWQINHFHSNQDHDIK